MCKAVTKLTTQWMFVCLCIIFKAVTDMMCTQQAQKLASFSQHPSPALLSQLCTLILQPLALGCTVLQQNPTPSLDSLQPIHLLLLTCTIIFSLLCLSLEVLHHWLWNLFTSLPLPAKWSHPVGKRGVGGWWMGSHDVCPDILFHLV